MWAHFKSSDKSILYHIDYSYPNYRISPTFHVSLLKPATDPRELEEVQTSPPIIVKGEQAYLVKELLDSRHRGRQLQNLVDWEQYDPEERSWVTSDDILDPNLITEFQRQHPEKPAPRTRGRPPRQGPSHRLLSAKKTYGTPYRLVDFASTQNLSPQDRKST